MIAFFPKPYPDELLYSLLCRYNIRSGNACYRATADDLYINAVSIRPDFEFVNRFNKDCINWLCKEEDFSSIIDNRTMFPSYVRFLPKDKRIQAKEALLSTEGNWRNMLVAEHTGTRYARYCPLCAKADRAEYGETYWHRKHQIRGLRVCPLHGCYLVDSTILIHSNKSPGFYDAESNIPPISSADYPENPLEKEFAKYVCAVFDRPVDMDSDYPIGYYLNTHLPRKYISSSGLVRSIDELYTDIQKFYGDIPILDVTHLQKIFNGYRYSNYEILILAFFLGISVDDIVSLPKKYKLQGIEKVYTDLSKKYNLDIKTVKSIGKAIITYSRSKTYMQRKCGPRELEWETLDEKLFPKVKEIVDNTLNVKGRPQKISIAKIQKQLNMPQKQLIGLPKCYQYVKEHQETITQFWAREIVWAYYDLLKDKKDPTVSLIRKKINIRKDELIHCIPFICDKNVLEFLQSIEKPN